MAQTIEEIMTLHPTTYPATTTLAEAARAMRDNDMGDGDLAIDRDPRSVLADISAMPPNN
jgi:CBS domain-containing protein